jgi:Flp pilus assembly protein CpaB
LIVQFAQKLLSTRGGTVAVAGFAALLAAGIFLVYLNRYRSSVADAGQPTLVLVAKQLIPKGVSGDFIAAEEMFASQEIARSELKDGALADPAALRGRVAVEDIYPDEQLTTSAFSATATDAIPTQISGSERALAVPLDAAHGMVGNIEPGDHVDVFAAFNVKRLRADGTFDPDAAERPVLKLIVEDVLVLRAPDKDAGGVGAGGVQTSETTLKVSDRQAAEIAFAVENGKVWLALRPSGRAEASFPDIVTLETILFGVRPVSAMRSFGARR